MSIAYLVLPYLKRDALKRQKNSQQGKAIIELIENTVTQK